MVRLRPVWMTNHPPSVLWHCWLGHQTCKNRRPSNLYCVGADVKPCSINQSALSSTVFEIFGPKSRARTHADIQTHRHTLRVIYILSHAVYCIGQTKIRKKI